MARRKYELLKERNMPTRNHLLVIGVDEYDQGFPKLNNTVIDAKRFARILQEKYDFEENNITALYNSDATVDNILDAFSSLRSLTENDNLIFYFAGHGEIEKATERGYWIPYKARYKKKGSYLNNVEVQDFIATCGARHILGIVDSCYSGSLFKTRSGSVDPEINRYYTRKSRFLMTSGLLEPVPDGRPGQHSPFAAALLSELENNRIPCLRGIDLWRKIEPLILRESGGTPVYKALEKVGHLEGEYFFMIANSDEIPPEENASTQRNSHNHGNTMTTRGGGQTAVSSDTGIASLGELKDGLVRLAMNAPEKAFKKIETILRPRTRIERDFLMLNARYNFITNEYNIGVLSHDDYFREMNRIKYSMGEFIDSLEEDDLA